MNDVDIVRSIAINDVVCDPLGIGIGRSLHGGRVVLGDDRLGIKPLDHRPALAADDVEQDGLSFSDQLIRLAPRGADDVAIERPGEAAVTRCNDNQMRLVLAGTDQQCWALRPWSHPRRERRHDLGDARRIGPSGDRILLRATKL